jgi:hypothetical protein
MIVRCVVAGHGFDGPDFWFVKVNVDQEQFDEELHKQRAEEWSINEQGVEGPCVVFDEFDKPVVLFDFFVWESASII